MYSRRCRVRRAPKPHDCLFQTVIEKLNVAIGRIYALMGKETGELDEVTSLADLVGEDDEEAVAVVSDDDTLSLSDIADQETSLDDDEVEEA